MTTGKGKDLKTEGCILFSTAQPQHDRESHLIRLTTTS
uniref:Uncharacterized protein n=1 Tax=Arundo donax TaxID=35708 RepID=A0A0A9AG77_ARUDO